MEIPALLKCSYCKKKVAESRDHIVPRQHGGPDEAWNLTPVCHECNGMLSCHLPARNGDTVGRIRWKKALFLTSCRKALRKNRRWGRLSKVQQWEEVRRGTWVKLLPQGLRTKYENGLQPKGRLLRRGRLSRWKS